MSFTEKYSDEDVDDFDAWCEYAEKHEDDPDVLSWKEWKRRKKIARYLHRKKDALAVDIPPKELENINDYSIDIDHIEQRGHSVDSKKLLDLIKSSNFSVTRWNGKSVLYFGDDVAVYVDVERQMITTAYTSDEYDEKTRKALAIYHEEYD